MSLSQGIKALTQPDLGAATAEFAILLPAAVALMTLAVAIGAQQLNLMQKQAELSRLARQVEAGIPQSKIVRQANALGFLTVPSDDSGMTCIQARFPVIVLGFAVDTERFSACALAPGF